MVETFLGAFCEKRLARSCQRVWGRPDLEFAMESSSTPSLPAGFLSPMPICSYDTNFNFGWAKASQGTSKYRRVCCFPSRVYRRSTCEPSANNRCQDVARTFLLFGTMIHREGVSRLSVRRQVGYSLLPKRRYVKSMCPLKTLTACSDDTLTISPCLR